MIKLYNFDELKPEEILNRDIRAEKNVEDVVDGIVAAYAFAAAEAVNPGHTRMGRIASGDKFVAEKDVKDAIIAATGGLCTEMEGAAIAQTAYRNGVPFVILRAISDKADDSAHMDYPTFERRAAEHCAAVTEMLAEKLIYRFIF